MFQILKSYFYFRKKKFIEESVLNEITSSSPIRKVYQFLHSDIHKYMKNINDFKKVWFNDIL